LKQRISADDVLQLTPEQQEKLRVWWNVQESDLFAYIGLINTSNKIVIDVDREGYMYDGRDWFPKMDCLPLLSIGQMIELLDNFTEEPSLKNENLRLSINRTMWLGNSKLVDSLFQAVKEILQR